MIKMGRHISFIYIITIDMNITKNNVIIKVKSILNKIAKFCTGPKSITFNQKKKLNMSKIFIHKLSTGYHSYLR